MLSLLLQFLGFPPKLLFSLLSYFPFGVQRTGKFPLLLSSLLIPFIDIFILDYFCFFFLKRNVCKCVGGDKLFSTCRETKGPKVVNGLESKIACNSSKVSYALDREVFLFQA
ncbi:hypothetical protein Gotri_003596, partial [Gossypium trilobum]|nr:hypothetical protein [Gossypium trilobum]